MTRWYRVRLRVSVQVIAVVVAESLLSAGILAQTPGQYASPPPYGESDIPSAPPDFSDHIPAHLSVVDGVAELERDGRIDPAEENVPLLAGDRVRTSRGRIEILFADGSALALDHDTDIDLLSDALLGLRQGRIRLSIARGASALAYRIDAAGTTTWIRSAGEYRVDIDNRTTTPDVRVTVLRGAAELTSPFGRTLVRTGTEARATAETEPSLPYAMNVAALGTFDRWVRDQQDYRVGRTSAQYLPAELRHYGGAFDREGSWEHAQGYGHVWYPTVVPGWQPYYDGGWSFVGSFGWTWIGAGHRWTWPTHHYGRWGVRSGRWFWVPGRRWAPAWVSWASAPGYISWSPLGFDNRPVISLTNITIYNSGTRLRWATVPSSVFVPGAGGRRHVVGTRIAQVPSETRFVLRSDPPVRPGVLRDRSAEPLRAPTHRDTRYAVPRASSSPTARPARHDAAPAPPTGARSRLSAVPARNPAATQQSPPVLRTAPARDAVERPSTYRLAQPRTPAPVEDAGRSVGPRVRTTPPREPASSAVAPLPVSPGDRRRVGNGSSRAPLPAPTAPAARPERPRAERAPARAPAARPAPTPRAAPARQPRAGRDQPAAPPAGRPAPAARSRAESRERR